MSDRSNVTQLLLDLRAGGTNVTAASGKLYSAVYTELHRVAEELMRGERPDHTLQPTALVHEAYLKLVDAPRSGWENRAHFFGTAARAMRQVLVDSARRHHASKRGVTSARHR